MKMSAAKRSEIAKKAWRKRKRGLGEHRAPAKRGTLSSAVRKPAAKKISRRPRRGTLSQMVTDIQARAAIEIVGRGAVGGVAASLLEKILPPTMPKNRKALWGWIGAFGMATLGNAPYTAAGMAAVSAYKMMDRVGLSENQFADQIEQLPMVLDSSGEPLSQSPETGGLYLQQNDDMYLQDHSYQVPYAPYFGAGWDSQNDIW